MLVKISGKNIDVGDALKTHVEQRINEGVNKYLDRATDANIVLSKESHFFKTDININTGTHSKIVIKSSGEDNDVYASFNTAAERIEKQLRRYKRKLKNHHKHNKTESPEDLILPAKKYVLQPEEEAHDETNDNDAPIIIAEKATGIEKLTVSEAVMKMDLADLPALMFINKANGKHNVVYKRADGNISWINQD